jgi:cytochrome c-type biogenesis protein CcmH/NrfG
MDSDSANESLRELVRLQADALVEQRSSFAQLVALQREHLANQERDLGMRRKLFRIMGVILVIYLVLALVPIFIK